ncbi:MAG: hypothetical protein U0361_15535 [Nitrospiraceae bacterium]
MTEIIRKIGKLAVEPLATALGDAGYDRLKPGSAKKTGWATCRRGKDETKAEPQSN